MISHKRVVINILDVISEFGGTVYIVVIFFGVLIRPISKMNYTTGFLEKLYVAKSKGKMIFDKTLVEKSERTAKFKDQVDPTIFSPIVLTSY